jgi:hypothetical protein
MQICVAPQTPVPVSNKADKVHSEATISASAQRVYAQPLYVSVDAGCRAATYTQLWADTDACCVLRIYADNVHSEATMYMPM